MTTWNNITSADTTWNNVPRSGWFAGWFTIVWFGISWSEISPSSTIWS